MADGDDSGRIDGRPEPVRDACGCEAGAAALLVAAATWAAYLLARPGGFWPLSLGDVATGAAVCVAAAIAGKAAGLLWARLTNRTSPKWTRAHADVRAARSPQNAPDPGAEIR